MELPSETYNGSNGDSLVIKQGRVPMGRLCSSESNGDYCATIGKISKTPLTKYGQGELGVPFPLPNQFSDLGF